ncbi:MAG TPA: extracellular solute-binding protein [Gaiellaceae bacterium]|nr:extracellular solute-binding protein [Gaiellaceae bacterium]
MLIKGLRVAVAATAGAAVLVLGTASAAARPDGAAAPSASSAVSGNIVLAHWASSPVETALLKQVIQSFERKYPRIHVTRRALDPYPDAMLAQFAARKPPDVFYIDSNVAPDWVKQRVIWPLNSYIKRYKFNIKPFYPRLLSAFQSGGLIYGFPKDWSPLAMQTNTAMFQRAGVQPPQTWAQLESVSRRLLPTLPSGAKPICLAADWARLLAFVYQNNGSFLNATKTRATVATPAVRQAVDFYVGLRTRGLAATPAELGVGWCGEALGKEKAAIVFEGNWVVPFMAESFPTVRFQNNRMVRGKANGNLAFTVSYSIARDSKNKPAAWTLLTYLTGKEGMRIWTSKGLALPARSDVKPVAGRASFLAQAPYSRPWQFAPGFSKVMTVAGNELSAVFEGKQSVQAMLVKVQAEATAALRRGGR